ncbi:MAG: DNA topoisomerase III [Acetivibrionales bacterium]|jgi:DNA topoisomerase-3
MKKTLVLAEKPSVARDIARVLECTRKGNGYLEGKNHIVTWALGHLVTLADPEAYNKKYKIWNLDDIPVIPSSFRTVVIRNSSRQFNSVKGQINRKDVGQIVIATDAGREGELVARWILQKVGIAKPVKRLWISSVTDRAIIEGFKNLRDGKEYESLYASAAARAEADWIVGINATRALTCKFNAQLSCGRVQTPTLAMIAKREEEILNFKPRTYYGITAVTDKLKLIWQNSKTKDIKTFDRNKRDEVLESIKGNNAEVTEVLKSYKKSFSPQLYDLTSLQRDANRIFDFSASETLSIMQRLYETHKLLTYPRTDSRYISRDIVDTLKERIKACSVGPYSKMASMVLRRTIKVNKTFVDDARVSDHHAIIPTEQPVSLGDLNERERKVYDLVVKRFLAVLYPPFEYEQVTLKADINGEWFYAKGKRIISKGWKEIYDNTYEEEIEDDMPDQTLPDIKKGDILKVISFNQTESQTKPPARFNEGSLLAAMENPIRYMNDQPKDLIKTIGEAGGIGTVATRADIIDKLFNSFLIEKKGKDIYITSKGRQLLELVPEDLKSPALTAQWEQKLAAISRGTINKDSFVNEMKNYTIKIVNEIKKSEEKFKHDNLTMNRCPDCGKFMLEVRGKKGKMLICQDRECGSRKMVSRVSNARCPECHKKMELYGEGEGQTFICACGYREKLSAFKDRKGKEGNMVSKKEVNNFLKRQDKNDNINTALADALAKLKKSNR